MAWWRRKSEIAQLRAELDVSPSLAREYDQVQRDLAETKRAFEARGTWSPADFSAYQNRITGLQQHEMSLRARGVGESRAIGWPEYDPRVPFNAGGPAHPSMLATGIDRALSLAPVYAASRLLADGVASLPLRVYKPDGNGAPVRYTGPSIFHSRPETALGPMGQGPSVTGTLRDWLVMCMTSLTLDGNAFGMVTSRDAYQYPTSIEWLPPARVHIDENDAAGFPNPAAAEYFFDGRHIAKEDMLHIRAYVVPGRVRGISPLRSFANLISQGLAMQAYGESWFQSGGFPIGVMKNSMQEVNDEQSAEIKSRLISTMVRHQPLVVGADWDYQTVSVPPEEASFVVSQQLNASMIAAAFGVPAYKIGGTRGDSLTYSSVEADAISFASESLQPWLTNLESAFYGVLPGNRYCRFDVESMIRTDSKTRREIYTADRASGIRTVDEIRQELDLTPLPGGAGKDELPLTISADLGRAGVAVPSAFANDLTMLNVPPGAAPEVTATGGNVIPIRPKGPAQVPPPAGEPEASVQDVAREWAPEGTDDAALRPYLAHVAAVAAQHGVRFRSPVDVTMAVNQRDWLLSFCRTQGEPQAKKTG